MSKSPHRRSHSPRNRSSHSPQNGFHPRSVIENVIQHLDGLISASTVKEIMEHNRRIGKLLQYEMDSGMKNFQKLKAILNVKSLTKWNRVSSILKKLAQKSEQQEYVSKHRFLSSKCILVIGGGLSGLRASIELLLLGAKVICVEKRNAFSRNNVIHLWPNVINDMYSFEAKRLYGQFCVGSIDHIAIRQLQLMLLKIALIYGLHFIPNVAFDEICPRVIEPTNQCNGGDSCNCCCHQHGFGGGAYAHFSSSNHSLANELEKQAFDVIIGCDGRRTTFSRYFPRNSRRGKLAIGLTANYNNRRTEAEASCQEISGISRIYHQKMFKDLQDELGVELENLVYYRDETHYFVMTPTKASLLRRGALKADYPDPNQLLQQDNIDTPRLMKFAKDTAEWATKLKNLQFAYNENNVPDVSVFDFTAMYSAMNASCAKKIYLKCCDSQVNASDSKYTLLLLCGDSLLEPFWPTGSGAGRGFLSALDAAWTVSQWFTKVPDELRCLDSMLNVIAAREHVYRLLAQTSPSNTTSKDFTLDPQTRYKNLTVIDGKKLFEIKNQVRHLLIDKQDMEKSAQESKRARRATVGIDPQDVLNARILTRNPANLYADHHFNQPVPSVPNCDNLDVVQLRPRNHVSPSEHYRDGDNHNFKPRNSAEVSSFNKKNHEARNHFFELDTNANNSDVNANVPNRYESSSRNLYSAFDGTPGDGLSHHTPGVPRNALYNQWLASEQTCQQSEPQKPKKSSEILERAQQLGQQLDELNKPSYSPNLANVGRLEDDDWNVRKWSSSDPFAAKKVERKNLVHENSQELLRSRVSQYHKNIDNDERKFEEPKPKPTSDWISHLTEQVTQRMSNSSPKKSPHLDRVPKPLYEPDSPPSTSNQQPAKEQQPPPPPQPSCTRCSKEVSLFDRFTIQGQIFHRACLVCTYCFIQLRHDEIFNTDYVCKICAKSRTIVPSTSFQKPLANHTEAKKNFLTNVQHVDLRERAEFSLTRSCFGEEDLMEKSKEEEEEEEKNQESDLSSSDQYSSDGNSSQNYTDDERTTDSSESRSSKNMDNFFENIAATETNALTNNCFELTLTASGNDNEKVEEAVEEEETSAEAVVAITSIDEATATTDSNPIPNNTTAAAATAYQRESPPPISAAFNGIESHSCPASDTSLVLHSLTNLMPVFSHIGDRSSLDKTMTTSATTTTKTTTASTMDTIMAQSITGTLPRNCAPKTTTTRVPKFSYSGHFTEKLYRTKSQPMLTEQMNLISQRLKSYPQRMDSDLPFADEQQSPTREESKIKLAPVVTVDEEF